MFYRTKQFFSALFAQLTEADRQYVQKKLSETEKELFYQMSLADQRHCLDVAYTIETLVKHSDKTLDESILIKAALLHDLGKKFGRFKLWHRVAIVIVRAISRIYWDKLCSTGKYKKAGSVFHSLYIYSIHPELGAKHIEQLKVDKMVVELVRQHHLKENDTDIPELQLLIMADELN